MQAAQRSSDMHPAATSTESAFPQSLVAPKSAWMLWLVTLALSALGLALAVSNHLDLAGLIAQFDAVHLVAAVSFGTVGLVIVRHRPAHRIGWLFCVAGAMSGAALFVSQYAQYALRTAPGSGLEAMAAWLNLWIWMPLMATILIFLPLLFPDGRLPSPRWRSAAWLAMGTTLLASCVAALSPGADSSMPGIQNPFGITGAGGLFRVAGGLAVVLVFVCLAVTLASVVFRVRRAGWEERQQLKWFAYATAVMVVAIIVTAVVALLHPLGAPGTIGGAVQALAVPCLPVAVGLAILRYRLWDIDLIINRTLVYGGLTGIVIGLYVLVVGGLGFILQARGTPLIAFVAAAVIAVLFGPLRDWLQRRVNRLMYGDRDDPYAVLSRLGELLEQTLVPEAIMPAVLRAVVEALRLPYGVIMLEQDDTNVVAAEVGHRVIDPVELPLVYQGETIGCMLLAPRAPGESFNLNDWQLLQGLARQAGVAAHTVSLTADLQRSRQRLVTAREEERRRLRRDLHDGLGPMLGSLTLKLDVAADLLERDPETVRSILHGLKTQARTAVSDIRRLVYALRPAALDDLGLVPALQEIADQYQGIAEHLGLTLKTVRNYVSSILSKLQVADRAQAIVRAREAGMGQ